MKLRYALMLGLLAWLAVPATSQNPAGTRTAPPATQDLTSPEAAVRSFVAAVNALDVNGANCLAGGKIDPALRAWIQSARNSGDPLQLAVISVKPQVNGDSATAVVSFEAKAHGQQQNLEETLNLRKEGAAWKIVPPTDAEQNSYLKAGDKDPHLLALLANAYVHPRVVLNNTREVARDVACRSNLKQLATGVLMFLQDSDEKFALKADSYKAAIQPYVKNESIFHCPSDEKGPVAYSFNAQLQGKRMAAVRKPSLTVLLYEGKKGVLNFRHNGRAMVAFADGHVKPVTPAEARTLRWAP